MATNIERFYNLTPLQEGMLFQRLYNSESSEYFIQTCLKVYGSFDKKLAKESINIVSARHDVLRTSFFFRNTAKPRQVVLKERKIEFNEHDLTDLDRNEQEDRLKEIKRSDVKRGFDLEKDTLLRITLVKMSEQEYRMIWSFHHIIMDGWCLSLLYGDFIYYYNQLKSGKSPEELKQKIAEERKTSRKYEDYIKWLDKQYKDSGMMYWSEVLQGYETEATIMPAEPVTEAAEVESAEEILDLSIELSEKVKRFSMDLGVTVSHIIESAWGILLQKYSNSDDVVFGKVVSGRNANIPGIEQMVGLFINTIPERITVRQDTTVGELLNTTCMQALESERYDFCPLAEVQARTVMGRGLINTLYVFENYFVDEGINQEIDDIRIEMEDAREQTNYTLSLSASMNKTISLKLMYMLQTFSKKEVGRLLKQLEIIIAGLISGADRKVSDIEVVTQEERKMIITEFNDTEVDFQKDRTIAELFEEQVDMAPEAVAVVHNNEKVTYKELNGRANQIAHKLRDMGIASDDFVAIMTERSIEMLVGIFGIIKAGGAYVPIDPMYPQERIVYMLNDCKPKAVLLYKAELPEEINIPFIDLEESRAYKGDNTNPQKVNTPDDLIYAIYTSGTTGRPKGVMIEHRGVNNLREYFIREQNMTGEDKTIQFASMAFDAMVSEISMSLLVGGCLHITPENTKIDSAGFESYIENNGITAMILPPQYIMNLKLKSSPRTIITAGSETNKQIVGEYSRLCRYSNDYGPTECSVCATHWEYRKGNGIPQRIPIGKPIANKQVYVLRGKNLCGIGMPGELCVAGVGLARGYLNQPELTDEKFIDNPFGEGKLYRTGDLARWLSDGNIEYLGRIDEQVKIRGFRIELLEIENVLRKLENVDDAAVIAREDKNKEKYIAAYIVSSEKSVDLSQIRELLRRDLPDYMIPSYFMQIDKIPVTRNGKLDKRALPEIEVVSGREFIAPRTETEEIVAKIFADVLNTEKVGIQDNFFEIGGHSLRATRVMNRLEAETGVRIPLKQMFANPTVEALSKYIGGSACNDYEPIPCAAEEDSYPMSSTQKRLYVIHEMDDMGIVYNMPSAVEMGGNLDVTRISEVFNSLIKRHQVLRTSFSMENGETLQHIAKEVEAEVEYEEAIGADDEQKKRIFSRFVRPFDLKRAPLMRIKLVKTGDEKNLILLDMHHIISDGMSMNIITDEFVSLYNGKKLKDIRVHYKDYSEWMRTRDLSGQKGYWLSQFSDEVPVLDLPLDYQRGQIQSFKGKVIGKYTSGTLKNSIDEMCRTTGATEYMVLLSGLMILLSKYSRREDIVIGTPISGRMHRDTENMIGMFVNTLAMRGKPEGKKTYKEFLKEIRENSLKAYENQEYPFDELVEAVEVKRDLSRNPLFDVMFAFQNNEKANAAMDGIRATGSVEGDYTVAKFDLTLNANRTESGYSLMFEYCTDLFEEATIEGIAEHYITLLEEIAENPDKRIMEYKCIDEAEKLQIIHSFNDTLTEYPKNKTVVELFEEQVNKNPHAVASVYEGKIVTYMELNEMANQIAHKLRSMGVKNNDFIAIMAERSIRMLAGILGIIKAGGAYVPIDSTYPKDRVEYVLLDCKPKALLLYNVKEPESINVPIIDLSLDNVFVGNVHNPERVNSSKDIIYVIYTSGTTGKPKGVVVEHQSVVRLVRNTNYVELNEKTVILQTGAVSFDASTFEFFGSLLNGGSLVLVDNDTLTSPNSFKKTILENKVNTVFITTALFNQMLDADPEIFSSLTYLLFGGEQTSEKHVRIMTNNPANHSVRLSNVYGPTENTTFSTYYEIQYGANIRKTPIGRSISNTMAYIMNGSNLCPIGMPGELCLAGDGIAKGYLNRPELSAEKFIPNPYGNGQLYRSGDLARWLPDGNIEYLGRIDGQVKIRGFRIELGEIENVIRGTGLVKDTAVICSEDAGGDKQLCAYVTGEGEIELDSIRSAIRKELPEYMVPAYMMQIDAIPLNKNGKLDKKALPEIQFARTKEYTAPRNSIEEIIAAIYEEILEIEQVGIHDNFFEIGGHSLRATRVINKIEAETGVRIPLKEMFANPTVEAMAQIANESKGNSYEPIPKAKEKDYYLMSSAQKRLYVIDEMGEKQTVYNMPAAVEMKGKLDKEKIEKVFRELTKRHEVLRTSFCMQNGEPIQRIAKEVDAVVEYQEAIGATDEQKKEIFKKFLRPFDLGKAPLMRLKVVKTSEDSNILLFDMHHIISDGMSMNIIQTEFGTLYNGGKLEDLRVQYKDYSEWMNSKDLESQKEYWVSQLSDEIPVLDIPLDYTRPQIQSYRGSAVDRNTGSKLKTQVNKLSKETGTTEYMVFLSGLMVLLSKYSCQEDIIVGTPISGRTHKDMENMLGMFVSTLVMRGKPEANKTYREFLMEIKETCLKAYENQEFPFEELVEEVAVKRDLSRNPLFDVMFVLQNNEQAGTYMNGLNATGSLDSEERVAKFDITVNVDITAEGYSLIFEYCSDLFKVESIEAMAEHYITLLGEMIENPDRKIGEYSGMDETERRKILYTFNITDSQYPKDKTVAELFEEQASATPDAIALEYKEQKITYEKLNQRANQIANRLREMGVQPDQSIAIMAERSIEMLVGILGIVKAGGAYVPIDPSYPVERIMYMLEDCKPKAVLLYQAEVQGNCGIPVLDLSLETSYAVDISNPERINIPNSLIYIIYTSGTTGKPKGSLIEHRSVVRLVRNTNYINLDKNTVILQTGAMSFDASTLEVWGSLLNGGKLVLVDNEVIMNPVTLKMTIESKGINTMWLTATLFNQMVDSDPGMFDSLTYLLAGGEKLSEKHVRRLKERNKKVNLINGYGPTENTTFTTTYQIPDEFDIIPIGKPISNSKVYILDGMNLCGIGMPGELCSAGDGLARGYLNRPDLTELKFIDNPFGEGKLYRTGDLARWSKEGYVEYLGRIDEQVKIRGFRIELGEIESVIRKLKEVADAAVVVRVDNNGEKYIAAYIVGREGSIDLNELRKNIGSELPEYMIPAYFMEIEKIPITRNGKLDKRALPEIELVSTREYIEPRNKQETILAEVFKEMLGMDKVGVLDSFFELGGDSIKAIRIVSKLREYGYGLEVKHIVQERTVGRIAVHMTELNDEEVCEQRDVTGEAELSPIQQMFFREKHSRPSHFNQSLMLRLNERIEEEALRSALKGIIKHHDILRSVYLNGKQIILGMEESKLFDLKVFDLCKNDTVEEMVFNENTKLQGSIDLENGPLVKVGLYRFGTESHVMIAIHHLVVDGVSWRILLEDFVTAYNQAKNGSDIVLPAKTLSYKAWTKELKEYGKSKEIIRERVYWEEINRQVALYNIPIEDTGLESAEKSHMIALSQEYTNKLLYSTEKAYRTGINDLLMCALGTAIKRWSGQDKVAVQLEGHGREEIGKSLIVDRTVGWFTNVYPAIVDASKDIKDNIIMTKEMMRQIPNHGMGYGIIKYGGNADLFNNEPDLCFNYLGDFDNEAGLQDDATGSELPAGLERDSNDRLSYSISINGSISAKQLRMGVIYDESRHSKESVERLCRLYEEALMEIIDHCTAKNITIKTASDFGAIGLAQQEVDRITDKYTTENVEKIYGLTPLQEGMLYHKLLDEAATEYVIQEVFKINSAVDIDAIRGSLKLLEFKYEPLRTAICYSGMLKPKQVVLKNREIELNTYEVTEIKEKDKADRLDNMKQADVKRGFDLENESLLRLTVIKVSENECVILWSSHHIIMDGWCTSILFRDFIKGYEALKNGMQYDEKLVEMVELEKKQVAPYSEYIAWLEKQDKEEGLTYWRELLSDYTDVAKIPSCVSEADTTKDVDTIVTIIDENMSEILRNVAISNNVTLNTMFECAWGIVLQRYNCTNDVVFGKVVSGRNANIKGIEQAVGLFINTIPVRIKYKDNCTLGELLTDVQEQAVRSGNYDYCSLAEVQNESELGANLFDTLFVFENYYIDKGAVEEASDITVELENAREETNYPITISVSYEKTIHVSMMYNPKEYSLVEANRILERIRCVLLAFVNDIDMKVSEIEILEIDEREQVLKSFNGDKIDYPGDKTVIDIFEEQVLKTPDKIAAIFEDEKITYRDLNERANAIASRLRNMGVKPEDFVAIMAERSIKMIIGIYGIIKAGGAYVPIDKTYPDDRITYMLNDCCPKAILVYDAEVPEGINIKTIDLSDQAIYEEKKENPAKVNTPEDLLYLIYTSGTTGKPKGVMIEHSSLINMVKAYEHIYYMSEQDTVLQFASMSFDQSVWDIFVTTLLGATLCLMPYSYIGNPRLLENYMSEKNVTVAALTPAYLRELNYRNLPKLKVVESGGAAADVAILNKWKKEKKVFNTYGPTEATVNAITFELDENDRQNIPIGKPIQNTSVYILDGVNLCGIGMPGELCIAGVGLARGYLKQVELTADKFIKNPFGEGRLYRTGDLARWLPDGNIEYMGRIDEQVKVRGFRIELGEIESVLLKQAEINDVAVIAREDKHKEKYIAAYIVSSNQDISIDKIRENIKKDLPDYMVPAYFMKIDKIPVTKNGKVNKKALPEIEVASTKEYIAPVDDIEKALVNIFEDVLEIKNIGIMDNFFELGGNSIKAIGVASKLKDAGFDFSIKDIMQNATVKAIRESLLNRQNMNVVRVIADQRFTDGLYQNPEHFKGTKVYTELKSYEKNKEVHNIEVSYEPFAYQKFFLTEEEDNICPSKINIYGDVSKNKILSCIRKIIKTQSVLRTAYNPDTNRMIEYEYSDNWYISYVEADLEPDAVRQADSIIMMPQLFGYGNLLSKIVVLRINDMESIVYFYVQHGLWDEMSSEILVELLNEGLNEGLKEEAVSSYSNYAVVRKNCEEESAEKAYILLDSFSEELKNYKLLLGNNTSKYICEANIKLNTDELDNIRANPIHWAMKLFAALNLDSSDNFVVPIILMHHGRRNEDFRTLGLYLDLIPQKYDSRNPDSLNSFEKNGAGTDFYSGLAGNQKYAKILEEYAEIIPLVNYYGQFHESNTNDAMGVFNVEIKKNDNKGCGIRMGIVNDKLFIQMPVNNTINIDKVLKKHLRGY